MPCKISVCYQSA